MDYKMTFYLYIGFLLKCISVVSSILTHTDNSVFQGKLIIVSFLGRFNDPLTQHRPNLMGSSCSLAKVSKASALWRRKKKGDRTYKRIIQWTKPLLHETSRSFCCVVAGL